MSVEDEARARVRMLAEKRVAEARQRLEFAERNGFSDAKLADYRGALELADAALWPWLEMDRMLEVFRQYYQTVHDAQSP